MRASGSVTYRCVGCGSYPSNFRNVVVFLTEHNDNTRSRRHHNGNRVASNRTPLLAVCSVGGTVATVPPHFPLLAFPRFGLFRYNSQTFGRLERAVRAGILLLLGVGILGASRWREELCSSPPPY